MWATEKLASNRRHLFFTVAAPQSVVVESMSSRVIVIRWDPPRYDPRDGAIEEYTIICRSPDNDPQYFNQVTVPGTNTEYTVSGVTPATTYECCITMRTTNGDSPFNCSLATTDEDGRYIITDIWAIQSLLLV